MIRFDEAISIIGSVARPLGTETLTMDQAASRVLAEPVVAAIDSPRADVSAMDGYAVRDADLDSFPVELDVVGESYPGAGQARALSPGSCVRIFTGAPLPAGADRIVIQEVVRRDGGKAIIDASPGPALYVRPRGKDFRAGDELLPRGRLLDPSALVAAAGADTAHVAVYRKPRLALLVTGDELAEPGRAREMALAVPDSVSASLAAFAERWGASIVERRRLRDELGAMTSAAGEIVGGTDVIVLTGGASVGERDFAKSMFEPLGLDLLFSRISIRPGKPAWLGRARGALVLGLPGNPTSALVTARLLLAPLLAGLTGRPPGDALRWEPARLSSALAPCDARETFHRARLSDGCASLLEFQESHAQKALADADILLRQAANSSGIDAGEIVQVLKI